MLNQRPVTNGKRSYKLSKKRIALTCVSSRKKRRSDRRRRSSPKTVNKQPGKRARKMTALIMTIRCKVKRIAKRKTQGRKQHSLGQRKKLRTFQLPRKKTKHQKENNLKMNSSSMMKRSARLLPKG